MTFKRDLKSVEAGFIPEPAFHSPNTFWYLLGAAIAVIWFWIFCLFFLSL